MHGAYIVPMLVLAGRAYAASLDHLMPAMNATRLIKSSEEDPGEWIHQDDLFERFTSKGLGFIDITDIEDPEVMAILNGEVPFETASAQTYPDKMLHVGEAKKLVDAITMDGPKGWIRDLSHFHTRDSRGKQAVAAADYIFEATKKAAAPNSNIKVQQVKHRWNQPSTIAILPGENPEMVILGAHFDSTAGGADARAPGADDNASGCAVVLEALRIAAAQGWKPKNTIEFHFYAAEEVGLLGAKDIFKEYKAQKKTVIGFLNQDMVGWQPSKTPAVMTDHASGALVEYITKVITEYTGKAPNRSKCGYACSDHAPATANGFPAVWVFEDVWDKKTPHYHSAKDTIDTVQWDAVTKHVKFAVGFMVEASHIPKSN
ncbi:hypothetical protein VHEMI02507 [[Torrubiella] hemipterigena]|uniref:Peptide hydrolase n=1 Tax=[Torrubiella] hemipterigena TaxID=1531966 RepID=A0A0A1T8D6_9HYPO|nr:hypothetical protein VHEMI02507 [[Torrubiella] hemipterigena]